MLLLGIDAIRKQPGNWKMKNETLVEIIKKYLENELTIKINPAGLLNSGDNVFIEVINKNNQVMGLCTFYLNSEDDIVGKLNNLLECFESMNQDKKGNENVKN